MRYYSPWLCRWNSCDPPDSSSIFNDYSSVNENPMTLIDKIGLTEEKPTEAEEKGRIRWEAKGDNSQIVSYTGPA
jgi:hypothetical protein